MSKILDEIQCQMTHKRYAPRLPLVDIQIEKSNENSMPMATMKEWDISAKFGLKVKGFEKDKHELYKNIFDELRHLIYGDFIEQVYKMELAFYEYDRAAFKEAIREIFRLTEGKTR